MLINKISPLLVPAKILLGLLLVFSIFKNISYPLFWADESMTAMGSERVLHYGYPKAHDGKNVLNDMFCSTPEAGVNEEDDAFIGGANWGQYYYGTIGYKLAELSEDYYTKTGIFRSTFAFLGVLGLLLLPLTISSFMVGKQSKQIFYLAYMLLEFISISLALHIREVRYYSPALLINVCIISAYLLYKFHKPIKAVIFVFLLALLLWLLFITFSPLYFVFIFAIAVFEITLIATKAAGTVNVKTGVRSSLPIFIALLLSFCAVYPLMSYFQTFKMDKMLNDFYHYNFQRYLWNLSVVIRYFLKLEPGILFILVNIAMLYYLKPLIRLNHPLNKVSAFLTILFILFILLICNIPSPIFTRYLIVMQPVLPVIVLIDLFLLYQLSILNKVKNYIVIAGYAFFFSFLFTFYNNFYFIKGHFYEMFHPYKGPLDYTIPYIKANYPKTDTLIIATNYEETSYMYYLHSKVIVGLVGNNLVEDSKQIPDIISYRQSLGSFFPSLFNKFPAEASYIKITFPIKDLPVNNIPELNFDMPAFNHYFKAVFTDDEKDETCLIVRQ